MRRHEFTLTGQLPGGKNAQRINHKTGAHYTEIGSRFDLWRSEAKAQILEQIRPPIRLNGRCAVTVVYRPGDDRRRDVPGMMDALCHVLESGKHGVGIVLDDSQLVAWMWFPLDKGDPMAVVTVQEIGTHPILIRGFV